MGMFDQVWAACPTCGKTLELQSKAGPCLLLNYTLRDAPPSILGDLAGEDVHCGECKLTWTVNVAMLANLIPKAAVPEDPDA